MVTSFGVSGRFLVRCHSAATIGARVANEFVIDGRLPAQNGQPLPGRVRTVTCCSQMWSPPLPHLHQTSRPEPCVISKGVRPRFLCAPHCAAIFGNISASERPGTGLRGRGVVATVAS